MYLDMGNMMSYNKGHGCEQPYVTCTLIPIPLEFELYIYIYIYIYLILSALVPVSAFMILLLALNVLHFINIGLSRQGREVFRSDWTRRCRNNESWNSY